VLHIESSCKLLVLCKNWSLCHGLLCLSL